MQSPFSQAGSISGWKLSFGGSTSETLPQIDVPSYAADRFRTCDPMQLQIYGAGKTPLIVISGVKSTLANRRRCSGCKLLTVLFGSLQSDP